jgi:iron complex outermembrane receptor protein
LNIFAPPIEVAVMVMRKIFLFFTLLFLAINGLRAQYVLSIRLIDQNKESVAGATVSIYNVLDSSKNWMRVSDSIGMIRVTVPKSRYTIRVEASSFETLKRNLLVNKNIDTVFSLIRDAKMMKGIVVTARKPLMRQEDDKTIVDPEPVALGSTHAFEVLEKIPGLFIDQDGNVYLNSTSPSAVWINGREQRMSAADIATMLKSLPPSAIDRVELVRTPSARYDASGVGGIVNIILKKNVKIGLTGSMNAGFNQGTYGNQFSGFNLNHSDGPRSSYLNVNLNKRNGYDQINTARELGVDSLLQQFSRTITPGNGLYIGTGLSREVHSKLTVGIDARININRSRSENENPTEIFRKSNSQVFFSTLSQTENNARSINTNFALNTKYKLDTAGSELNQDLSYSFDPNQNEQTLDNRFLLPFVSQQQLEGDANNQSHFITYQANLLKKLEGKWTVESGIKTANLWFNNDTKYFFLSGSARTPDLRRTNQYNYNEHIHAGYVQGSKTMGAVVLKTGLRLENTNMIGQQTIPTDTTFTVRRTDAFPYVYLSRALMKIAGYELRGYLVYRRSITRPSYSLLNPAIRILDPFLYEKGNPSLRPQFTQNYEANISVDERPLFAVGINQTKDIFTQVLYQADSSRRQAFRTYDNVGSNREMYFRGIAAIPPGKKYFFVIGAQYNHNNYDGKYEGAPLVFRRGSWTLFSFHNLKLTKTTQLSFQGFVRFKGQLQFYELSTFGAMNSNLSQQLLKRKLTLTLSVNDILYTNRNNFLLSQGTVKANGERFGDTRRFGLNLRYNFGIRKKEKEEGMMDQITNNSQ